MDALRRALSNGELPVDLQQRVAGGSMTIMQAVEMVRARSVPVAPDAPEITEFAVAVAEYMSAVRALHSDRHCAVLCAAESPTEDGKGWEPTHGAALARYEAANTTLELWLSVEAMR